MNYTMTTGRISVADIIAPLLYINYNKTEIQANAH